MTFSKSAIGVTLSALAILALVNFSIYQQEQQLANGDIVVFELAPVDPRSLMQGDYMALNYQITNQINQANDLENHDGLFIVTLAQHQLAQFEALYQGQTLQPNQQLIQYRVRSGRVKLASNAFFFEEGRAEEFAKAKYGEFRVNPAGKLLLSNMLDKDFKRI
ncbi:GDYXXLXY domain-containing protein [Shewanella sp. HL-SH2]|uniref:GDYXXLXY domain-containing protein n=1 Tax=Shewanella sp. HL-SH2 TaxID=3436238 RepID=UPI003EBA353A